MDLKFVDESMDGFAMLEHAEVTTCGKHARNCGLVGDE